MFSKKSLGLLVATALCSTSVLASTTLAVVGSWSSLPLNKQFENPFWTQTLEKDSNNEFVAQMTTHDQMGVGGGDVFRMLGDGVFDVGMTVADYAVSDAPALEALDVPLIATTVDEAHKVVDAARPMVEEVFKKTFNSKVLAIVPYPPQVIFCKTPVSSLADLKGKKIRASGRMTANFLEALGAQSVNIAFGEVPGALQRGVLDCAVTGAGSGYSAGWWEVASHLVTLPVGGWDPVVTAINMDKWNALSAKQQAFLQKEVTEKFEKPVWDDAKVSVKEDVACLTGNGKCSKGPTRNMTLVVPSDADKKKARDIVENKVLPDWAARAGSKWTKEWNDSVGKLTHLTATKG
ncbi:MULTISPECIES: TRAP transporter substrate-binding protein [Vibrio]|uniref:C4-dicarboxylate ABC transporter substrate-binding protein n=2 Tax=Vibrio TaxID=662 RepID=A0A7X4RWV9_9VIBR|nr:MULTISPECIES: TRAP transporter substrate-binding protein [Vibrio]MBF8999016.1 TRAP transporter substrate-binding protein [Vibrio nitrifigilis]MZI95619.1 C4-dicarboxylate ABC transporter substrate-binding protein [Vibrio eleionomae]